MLNTRKIKRMDNVTCSFSSGERDFVPWHGDFVKSVWPEVGRLPK